MSRKLCPSIAHPHDIQHPVEGPGYGNRSVKHIVRLLVADAVQLLLVQLMVRYNLALFTCSSIMNYYVIRKEQYT